MRQTELKISALLTSAAQSLAHASHTQYDCCAWWRR